MVNGNYAVFYFELERREVFGIIKTDRNRFLGIIVESLFIGQIQY
jgi:hypothetical protein